MVHPDVVAETSVAIEVGVDAEAVELQGEIEGVEEEEEMGYHTANHSVDLKDSEVEVGHSKKIANICTSELNTPTNRHLDGERGWWRMVML
ncbi:unnamed protein product [Hydatigera taeniaeformis]|uniref:Uncharacterized protein n=1 Tax=Hydatigena taeniaeformis TaxID=6205 RepID=A0A0R3WKZ6_HYDTA|nr:unnamed protein product [Hydatigera taeniaeformis]